MFLPSVPDIPWTLRPMRDQPAHVHCPHHPQGQQQWPHAEKPTHVHMSRDTHVQSRPPPLPCTGLRHQPRDSCTRVALEHTCCPCVCPTCTCAHLRRGKGCVAAQVTSPRALQPDSSGMGRPLLPPGLGAGAKHCGAGRPGAELGVTALCKPLALMAARIPPCGALGSRRSAMEVSSSPAQVEELPGVTVPAQARYLLTPPRPGKPTRLPLCLVPRPGG